MNEQPRCTGMSYLTRTGSCSFTVASEGSFSDRDSIDDQNEVLSEVLSAMNRTASLDQLPPPDHCSTPKVKSQARFARQSKIRRTPVSTWIADLKDCYQPECTTTLQSKPLVPDIDEKVKILASLTSQVIRTLHQQTYSIAMEFDNFYRCLEMDCSQFIRGLAIDLVNHMVSILLQHSDGSPDLSEYTRVAYDLESHEPFIVQDLLCTLNALTLDFSRKIDKCFLQQLEILNSLLSWKRGTHAEDCECKGCAQF